MPAAGGTGLSPFSLLTGVALVVGYGLLGACWLVWKTEGELQLRARQAGAHPRPGDAGLHRRSSAWSCRSCSQPSARAGSLSRSPARFAGAAARGVPRLALHPRAQRQDELAERRANHRHDDIMWRDAVPFFCALGLFLLAYIGLGISMWPLIVPPEITIWDAAAPPSSQLFLLVGAAVLDPGDPGLHRLRLLALPRQGPRRARATTDVGVSEPVGVRRHRRTRETHSHGTSRIGYRRAARHRRRDQRGACRRRPQGGGELCRQRRGGQGLHGPHRHPLLQIRRRRFRAMRRGGEADRAARSAPSRSW